MDDGICRYSNVSNVRRDILAPFQPDIIERVVNDAGLGISQVILAEDHCSLTAWCHADRIEVSHMNKFLV